MDTSQLTALFQKLEALRAEGKEAEAKTLLMENMQQLPEDTRGEILLAMFTGALEQEAAGMQAIRDIQEAGLAAAEELEKEKGTMQ